MYPERIILDVECQRDFFSPGGSCYSEESAAAARNIHRLFAWARMFNIPVISTVLRVRSGEIGPLADVPHCLEGTDGERKLPKTVLPSRINLGLRNSTDLPDHIFQYYQQVIFEKRFTDIFAHTRAERLITELPRATFIVCGAGMEAGIAQATIGLRTRGFPVVLAADACLALRPQPAAMARLRMDAKGVVFTQTEKIVTPPVKVRRLPFRAPNPAGRQAF